MICCVETHIPLTFSFDCEELARLVLTRALEDAGCPFEARVDLTVTDDAGIAAVNNAQRGIDHETDVLSFPALAFDVPAHFDAIDHVSQINLDPETNAVYLGDILINADAVKRQALSYGHSEEREFAFLTVHALLHLIGYDHETAEEEEIMHQKQEAVLCALRITRDT